jgi:hypothetical protein
MIINIYVISGEPFKTAERTGEYVSGSGKSAIKKEK